MVSVATDDELLTSGDAEAFGVFYDRHVRDVLAYMMRRTGDPEAAADLTAETFAAAIVARRRYRPGPVPAVGWLFAIAQRRLVDHQRRGYAEQRLRRRLGMERRAPGEEDLAMIRVLGDAANRRPAPGAAGDRSGPPSPPAWSRSATTRRSPPTRACRRRRCACA